MLKHGEMRVNSVPLGAKLTQEEFDELPIAKGAIITMVECPSCGEDYEYDGDVDGDVCHCAACDTNFLVSTTGGW